MTAQLLLVVVAALAASTVSFGKLGSGQPWFMHGRQHVAASLALALPIAAIAAFSLHVLLS